MKISISRAIFGVVLTSSLCIVNTPLIVAQEQLLISQENKEFQEKIRIAVLDFGFSTISSPYILGLSDPDQYLVNNAKGISDRFIDKLIKTGKYQVVERSHIERILGEQDLGQSGRVDSGTAADIGKVLGVPVVIVGRVTKFDVREVRKTKGIVFFAKRKKTTTVDVQLNIRLVNASTGEILLATEGQGQASDSDSGLVVPGFATNTDEQNTQYLLSAATEQAIDKVVGDMNDISSNFAALAPILPGTNALVADIYGREIIINKGSAVGYKNGMVMTIERVIRVVKDPETKKVIRRVTRPIGSIELTQVDSNSSVGRIISGSGFSVGNLAKPKSLRK